MDDALKNDVDAQKRAEVRLLMAELRALSEDHDWACIGLKSLLWKFGRLIAREVEAGLAAPPRDQALYPAVLDTIAEWAAFHALEYQDPEEAHVGEALDAVKQAAVRAGHVVAAYERGRHLKPSEGASHG